MLARANMYDNLSCLYFYSVKARRFILKVIVSRAAPVFKAQRQCVQLSRVKIEFLSCVLTCVFQAAERSSTVMGMS